MISLSLLVVLLIAFAVDRIFAPGRIQESSPIKTAPTRTNASAELKLSFRDRVIGYAVGLTVAVMGILVLGVLLIFGFLPAVVVFLGITGPLLIYEDIHRKRKARKS
jgi:hypothetical protein